MATVNAIKDRHPRVSFFTPQGGEGANMSEMTEPLAQEQETAESNEQSSFTPINTQEEFNNAIKARLARERAKYAGFEEFKDKAAKFDEIEAANKTELEKLTERLEQAEKKVADYETAEARNAIVAEVAHETGLPIQTVAILRGETKDELLEAAALVQPKQPDALPSVPSDRTHAKTGQALSNGEIFAESIGAFFH